MTDPTPQATGWTLGDLCPAPPDCLAAFWRAAEQRHTYLRVYFVCTAVGPPPYESQALVALVFDTDTGQFVPAPMLAQYCGWSVEPPGQTVRVHCPYGHVEA